MVVTIAPTVVGVAAAPLVTRPGLLSMTIRVESDGASICVGEPCLLRATFLNTTDREMNVPIELSPIPFTRLTVYAGGQQRPTPSLPIREGDLHISSCLMMPGRARSFLILVPGSLLIQRPGHYRIAADQLSYDPARGTFVKVAEAEARLLVRPRDQKRLEAKCHEWYRAWREGGDGPGIPGDIAFAALMAVRDDAALPYFDQLFRLYSSPMECAFEAIRRVGSPRAKALVAALAGRGDDVGARARELLKRRVTPTRTADPFPMD